MNNRSLFICSEVNNRSKIKDMEKVIAILTHNGKLSEGLRNDLTINFFKMNDSQVTEVESIILKETSYNHFSLLMTMKNVKLVYFGTVGEELRRILNSLDIRTKSRDELYNDEFINKFVFDY